MEEQRRWRQWQYLAVLVPGERQAGPVGGGERPEVEAPLVVGLLGGVLGEHLHSTVGGAGEPPRCCCGYFLLR